jgi:hypothetical protein
VQKPASCFEISNLAARIYEGYVLIKKIEIVQEGRKYLQMCGFSVHEDDAFFHL